MKRFLLFLFFILFIPLPVNALELDSFEVLNGNLLTPFDKQNNVYTVHLNDSETKMKFQYDVSDSNIKIEELQNEYHENGESKAVIVLTNDETSERSVYTFYLEKEGTSSVFAENIPEEAAANSEEIEHLAAYVIGACSISILVLFKVIVLGFRK